MAGSDGAIPAFSNRRDKVSFVEIDGALGSLPALALLLVVFLHAAVVLALDEGASQVLGDFDDAAADRFPYWGVRLFPTIP